MGSSVAGAMVGGTLATLPLVAAAPAAFGAGAGGLMVRSGVSLASGAALGGADAAVRSDGDLGSIGGGAALGGALGAVGPGLGHVAGKVVGAVRGGTRGEPVLREALHGFPEADLAAAQALREQSLNLPGGGVPLSFDEALNQVTGGRATRLSQIARVTANSGGEAGRMTGEFYAARPGQVERTSRASFDLLGSGPVSPSALGIEAQTAARAGIAQTPEGMALTRAREAVGPRLGDDAAGQVIQRDLRATADLREAVRQGQAARDYGAARNAPENAGIERMVTVERPGEPIVTQPAYSRPQFTDAAPRPLEAFTRPAAEAGNAGSESLARFIARNGGLDLTGDLRSQDFHRFNIPGAGTVAREGGKPLDSFWRPKLIEAGYLRPDVDGGMQRDIRGELLRKLTNERRGVPSYPIGQERGPVSAGPSRMADDYSASLSLAENRLNEDLARVGVDPESVHPDIRSRTLGALMRGERVDPLDAYERTVGAMKGPLQPYSRFTTVTEQIPVVRFGQIDPRPALDAIGEQARTAKGDVRSALGNALRDLFEPGGEVDMSIDGLLHARERLDFQIRSAQEVGDATKVRDLTITRNALDGQLKGVPEVATADANFATNSRPLEPFTGNTPLGRIVRQDSLSGRMATPTEQVPTHLQGASATREFLANATPAARQAYEGNLATRLMDSATDARGNITAEGLMKAIREHGDVLDAAPGVRDRLADVARARDALALVDKTPLGKVAATDETGAATRALFPANPLPNSQGEVGGAMAALARNNPPVARALARTHLEGVFNEATQTVRGVAQQYGGAGFASAVRGNPQQRTNLDAALRALPDGEHTGSVMDRLLTALEATGYRPQRGSDTAFNQAIQKQLGSGKTPVGQAVSDVVSSAALGGAFGGLHGAAGGAFVGLRSGVGDAVTQARMMGNTAAVARMLLDPAMAPSLQALARKPAGSRGTEDLVQRLLLLARSSGMQGREPRPLGR